MLSWRDLVRLAWRCLFVQMSWNFKGFQNLGRLWVLSPFLRRWHHDRMDLPFCSRYGSYFNTNVFLLPTVLAATLALEEKDREGQSVPLDGVAFGQAVMAPVAAVGDALFWGGLRPLIVLGAVVLAWFGYTWSPWLALLLFVLLTTYVRLYGVFKGYALGPQVVGLIQQFRLAGCAVVLKQMSLVVLGSFAALLADALVAEPAVALSGPLLVGLVAALTLAWGLCCCRRVVATVLLWWCAVAVAMATAML
ncbi:MAG: PTS system mannose/fructose/sorbose family transporter subunit IID [Desulfuromonadaceae bacterium]|nr:PTS system mannose/fructose/sorbose family transporter subunit IID [Desulfuromonadaceae bacterium]